MNYCESNRRNNTIWFEFEISSWTPAAKKVKTLIMLRFKHRTAEGLTWWKVTARVLALRLTYTWTYTWMRALLLLECMLFLCCRAASGESDPRLQLMAHGSLTPTWASCNSVELRLFGDLHFIKNDLSGSLEVSEHHQSFFFKCLNVN